MARYKTRTDTKKKAIWWLILCALNKIKITLSQGALKTSERAPQLTGISRAQRIAMLLKKSYYRGIWT
jgi:hypothetical protein